MLTADYVGCRDRTGKYSVTVLDELLQQPIVIVVLHSAPLGTLQQTLSTPFAGKSYELFEAILH